MIGRAIKAVRDSKLGHLGQRLSVCYALIDHMRHPSTNPGSARDSELIATFGACRLLKCPDGRFEFSGGTPEDRAQAEKWARLFLRAPETGRETPGTKG